MEELVRYREPVRNRELVLARLRVEEILVPRFQRDLSPGLVGNLRLTIERLGFLHPLVVCEEGGRFYVLDGHHRLEAMRELGQEEVVALVVPRELALDVLDLNTEKPPNVRERARQTYRLFQELLERDPDRLEADLRAHLKEPGLVTAGFVLEELEPRFPASFYEPLLAKIDRFLEEPLPEAARERRRRAGRLLAFHEAVSAAYQRLGLTNPLLKGEIVRRAVQATYGPRVRRIEDDFYQALEKLTLACGEISFETEVDRGL